MKKVLIFFLAISMQANAGVKFGELYKAIEIRISNFEIDNQVVCLTKGTEFYSKGILDLER